MSKKKEVFDIVDDSGKKYKMIHKKEIWVKKKPLEIKEDSRGVMFIFNDNTQHHWELYDEYGHQIDSYKIEGWNSTPSFYVSGATFWFKFDVDDPEDMNFEAIALSDVGKIKPFITGNYLGIETEAPGWAIVFKDKNFDIKPVKKKK